ncbi:MAG: DUF4339 domain-containing protein [Thermoguttaceae bacterium]
MVEAQWYFTQNGRQQGPVSFYQLQQLANAGTLTTADHVWTEGQQDWRPAGEIAGLFSGRPAVATNTAGPGCSSPADPDLVMPSVPPRDPTVMAILSALVPGLGQVIVGQTVKGIVLGVLAIGLMTVTRIGGLAVFVVAIIDAYQVAVKLRKGQPVRQWEFF